jgi:hypothetical protein
MNLAQFLTQFPEFKAADADLVISMLTAAQLEIDPAVWRAKSDQGQGFLAAHKLALSPFGQNTRLVAKDGSTTYEKHFEKLRAQVASGFRVA